MPAPVIDNTKLSLETLMDALGYLLSTDSRTSNIEWILGDVGMGRPTKVPFGYIQQVSETVTWYTAQGKGSGGLAAGLDDWQIPINLVVAFEAHRFIAPINAIPPSSSPFNPSNNNNQALVYQEQPGWRQALEINQNIKKVLRTNITVLGAATDTRIVESRYLLQAINNELYRAARTTVIGQQRRVRGN